jgi:hypothetical protein
VNEADDAARAARDFQSRVDASDELTSLEKALEQPGVADALLDLVAARLSRDSDTTTWGELRDSFAVYLGRDPVSIEPPGLLWTWAQTEPRYRQMLEDAFASRPRIATFVKRVVGKYGPEIRHAYQIWNENPHDWRSVNPRVLLDSTDVPSLLQIVVKKINGEELYLEGPATSILQLTSLLIQALRRVDPKTFRVERVMDFEREAMGLIVAVPAGSREWAEDALILEQLESWPPDDEDAWHAADLLRRLSPPAVALLERYRLDEIDSRHSGVAVGLGRQTDGARIAMEADAELKREGLVEPTTSEGWTRLSEQGRAVARLLRPKGDPPPGIAERLGISLRVPKERG